MHGKGNRFMLEMNTIVSAIKASFVFRACSNSYAEALIAIGSPSLESLPGKVWVSLVE
jgi:hypothetical protein